MDKLYSTSLQEYKDAISSSVTSLIKVLKEIGVYQSDKILEKDGLVAIPITISVSLPSGGPVGGIDIREVEPILIAVSNETYPFLSPKAYSDRKDFPKNKLSHLYASKKNEACGLCLNRNGASEWFAENTVQGFIQAIEEWFYKAGSGFLTSDGNEFDPIRLDKYVGIHAYAYTKLFDVVKSKISVSPGVNFAILFGTIARDENEGLSVKSYEAIPLAGIQSVLKVIEELGKKNLAEHPLLSILCWPDTDQFFSEYDTDFPETLAELETFCKQYNIDIGSALSFYINNNLKTRVGIPIIIALKRPKKLIGYEGDVEFMNFLISGELQKMKLPTDTPVSIQNHIEPFTSQLAGKISGQPNNKKIMFLGGGALGSKIYLHKLRAGNRNMTVVDNDKLLHHNLVRHALHSNRLGKNKAEALIKEGKDYFEVEQSKNLKAVSKNIVGLCKEDLEDQELIIDTTASLNIQNWLTLNENITNQVLFRAEIAFKGSLGFLYKEGGNRNPRIDDLVNFTYHLALSYPKIEAWRKYDSEKQLENLPIGLGCNSTTTLIADDDISLHAAMFSKLISSSLEVTGEGYIYLNNSSIDFPYSASSELIPVKPFEIFDCINDKNWSIRMAFGISEKMHSTSRNAKSKEAAGVLVGLANYKTKVVHVFDLIDAPADSVAECACFYRGIHNLPEAIDEIKKRTGGLIGYIGEWHSHPMGLDSLSGQDRSNVAELKAINDKVPIPTLSIIVSNGKILPFIFD